MIKLNIYDGLLKLSQENKKYFETMDPVQMCNTINSLKEPHPEILFIIIIHHFQKNNGDEILKKLPIKGRRKFGSSSLIYSGKTITGEKGGIFTLNQLPEELQAIIYEYYRQISS